MIQFDFSGKVALVVGGTSSIGSGIAQALVDAGASVHITGSQTAPENPLPNTTYHSLDLTDSQATAALGQQFQHLDILVHCAGIVGANEFDPESFDQVMTVNLTGPMQLTTALEPALSAARGSVINLSSLAAIRGMAGVPAYCASKAGIAHLTQSLAVSWADKGIRVNSIAPGYVASRLTSMVAENPDMYSAVEQKTPLGRWGTPEDMANAALFLASPQASFITGQLLVVDGGLSLLMA